MPATIILMFYSTIYAAKMETRLVCVCLAELPRLKLCYTVIRT